MDGGFLCLSLMENKQMLCALGCGCQKAGGSLGRERWKFGLRQVEVWAEEKKWWIRGMRGVGKSLNNHLRITYESPMNHL